MTHEEFLSRYQYDPGTDQIGKGGFGSVYKARDTVRKRYVAIKESMVDPKHKFTLQREVELSHEIAPHPHVAKFENCYRFSAMRITMDYAVMEYYPEGSLSEVIRNHVLSESEKRELIRGVLQGIAHLHNQGVIHRDLKSGNILVKKDSGHWIAQVTDFGLSRLAETDASISNSSIGVSFAFAAPEQIKGSSTVHKNLDLWAAGVIIYHILTGKLPFTADGITDTNSANLEISRKITQRILPTDFRALPEPYHAMIDRCWVIEPEKRVKRAEELLEMMNVSPPDKSETKPETPVPPRRHVTPSDAGDYVFETVNHSDSVKSTPVPAGVVKPSGVPVTKIDRPKPPPAKPVPPAKPSKPPRSQWGKIFWLMGIITLVVIVVIYFFRPEVKPNPDQRSPTDTHNPTDQTNTVSSPPSTASSPTTSAAPEAPQWIAEYDKLMRGAQSCYNNRDYAAAKREYNKALEQIPSTDTQNRKGVVTNKIADCDRMLEKERQDKADAQEKQKIAEIATILSQANTAFKAKKWDEAFRLYAKAKQLDPGNTAGYDKFLEKGKSMKAINGGKCDVNIMQHLERAQKLKNTDEVRRILTECK